MAITAPRTHRHRSSPIAFLAHHSHCQQPHAGIACAGVVCRAQTPVAKAAAAAAALPAFVAAHPAFALVSLCFRFSNQSMSCLLLSQYARVQLQDYNLLQARLVV